MKKLAALILIVLILTMALFAFGESMPSAKILIQYMPGIIGVNNTEYVLVTEKFTHYGSIYTTSGEKVATLPFSSITYSNYGLFTAYNGNGVNNRALASINGDVLTEAAYGAFIVYNSHWALGLQLSANEAGTYKRGNEMFDIEGYDVFYFGDEPTKTPIGYIPADAFKAGDVHGDYISITSPEDVVTVYDKNFKKYDVEMPNAGSPIYVISDFAIIDKATGEMIKDGFTEAREQKVPDGVYIICTRFNYKGVKESGIIDTSGNLLMPINYTISAVTNKYVVFTDGTNKGLYSLEEQKEIVPCQFTNIVASNVSSDSYVNNGYVIVENGDLRGYYDVKNGEVSLEPKLDKTSVITIGCSTFWQTEEGKYVLVAADGVETELELDSIEKNTRGNGYLLVAKKDGYFGLIDWHGNEVLPFCHNRNIVVTDDSRAILRTSTGTELTNMIFDAKE